MTAAPVSTGWTGTWVTERLGLELRARGAAGDLTPADLVGLAVRRNQRRAHLLVSRVLGKHVPTDPRLVYAAGRLLGARVADLLAGQPDQPGPAVAEGLRLLAGALADADADGAALLACCRAHTERVLADGIAVPAGTAVLGYAETATALGHAVADSLGADYLHSTRRPVPGMAAFGGFEEAHSHATGHLLLPEDPELLTRAGPLVLVDDELSTGQTVRNTIAALHRSHPRTHYVLATLVDVRSDADRREMAEFAERHRLRLDVVSLARGHLDAPSDVLARGLELVERHSASAPVVAEDRAEPPPARRSAARWPVAAREGGRHGFGAAERAAAGVAAASVAATLATELTGDRVLVLGCEELMYAPLLIATALAEQSAGARAVRFSTTTRSPVLAVDAEGYAIRTALAFGSHDDPADGPGPRFAYNVAPGIDPSRRFSDIVLVVDAPADTTALHAPDGLLARLATCADRVLLLTLPAYRPSTARPRATGPRPLRGPEFGSYRPDEVGWLLTDLSRVRLEAPTEEREEAIQAGRAHYAESLPVEYQPGPEYHQLFRQALAGSAARLAHAVGVVTELVLAERGPEVVLVSLARAGTPVGVLMRDWCRFAHGAAPPHYAISIVRGRGIDAVALGYLAARHDPAKVMFVDGWTGKGAITRELAAAVELANAQLGLAPGAAFDPELAVLADPGRCVRIFGTREDFLIPSACLNSTVSGLVSRTVLNPALLGPADFHGAKFYAELAGGDVSAEFLHAVREQFAAVAERVAADWARLRDSDRAPTWDGWRAVERISAEYGVGDVNLVKPGVGETTRVLLRRVPWKVLVHPGAAAELAHVRSLAEQRGVELVEVAELPYSCVGLIRPGYTRGGSGES